MPTPPPAPALRLGVLRHHAHPPVPPRFLPSRQKANPCRIHRLQVRDRAPTHINQRDGSHPHRPQASKQASMQAPCLCERHRLAAHPRPPHPQPPNRPSTDPPTHGPVAMYARRVSSDSESNVTVVVSKNARTSGGCPVDRSARSTEEGGRGAYTPYKHPDYYESESLLHMLLQTGTRPCWPQSKEAHQGGREPGALGGGAGRQTCPTTNDQSGTQRAAQRVAACLTQWAGGLACSRHNPPPPPTAGQCATCCC